MAQAGRPSYSVCGERDTKRVLATVVPDALGSTLWPLIDEHVQRGSTLYTDHARVYRGMGRRGYEHESVNHSAGEYVREQAHINGIESFWAMLKRAHKGTFHKISKKHLYRYIQEFAGRHNIRDLDTIEQMCILARGMVGQRLRYRDLIA